MGIVKAIFLTLAVFASLAITAWVVFGTLVDSSLERRAEQLLRERGVTDPEVGFRSLAPRITAQVNSHGESEQLQEALRRELPEVDFDSDNASLSIGILPSVDPDLSFAYGPQGEVTITGQVAESDADGLALMARRLEESASVDSVELATTSEPSVKPLMHLLGVTSLLATVSEVAQGVTVTLRGRELTIVGNVQNEGQVVLLEQLFSEFDEYEIENKLTLLETQPDTQAEAFWVEVSTRIDGVRVVRGRAPADSPAVQRILEASVATDDSEPLNLISYSAGGAADSEQAEIVADIIEKLAMTNRGEFALRFTPELLHIGGEVLTAQAEEGIWAHAEKLKQTSWAGEFSDEIIKQTTALAGSETFELSLEDGFVKLSGDVRDGSLFKSLETEIASVLPEPLVKNELSVQPDLVESYWSRNVEKAVLPFLSGVESGVLSISDQKVRLDGVLLENADRRLIQHAALEILPPGVSMEGKLQTSEEANRPSPEEIAAAKAALVRTLKSLPIYFKVNSEEVTDENIDTLEKLSDLLAGQPDNFRFLVAGFSDSTGNASYNRKLALNRAGNVQDLLVSNGVREDRLVLKSLGELGSYSSKDKWKARRVEVKLASELPGEAEEQD